MTAPTRPRALDRSQRHGYEVLVPARGLAAITAWFVATVIGVLIVDRAGQVFALLLAALVTATIAQPLVHRLGRIFGGRRAVALVLVTVGGMVVVVAGLALLARDIDRQAHRVADGLHTVIADLPVDGAAANLAADLELDERIDAVLDGAAVRVVAGEADPITIAGQLGKVVVVGVMAAFIIAGGRRLLDGAIGFVRRASMREQLHASIPRALWRAGAFLRRTLTISAAHGVAVAVVCAVFDLPAPITVGAWAAVVITVPILGGPLAWAPVAALASAMDHSAIAFTVLGVAMIVVDRIVRRRWASAALRVGPLLTLIGIAVGWSTIGVSGAVVGMFVVATIAALLSARPAELGGVLLDLVDDPVHRHITDAVDEPTSEPDADVDDDIVRSERRPRHNVLRVRLSVRTAAAVAVGVVAVWTVVRVVGESQSLVVWFTVGGFIAVGLDRPVSALGRRFGAPRLAAIAIVLGAFAAVGIGLGVTAGPSIVDSARSIAADAPETVQSMESLPIVGRLLADNDAAAKVEDFLATLPERVRDSDAVDRLTRAAGDGVMGGLWTVSAVLAILLDGPRLVRAGRARVPLRHRREAARVGRAAYTALSNVVAAAAFVAALNGTVVMLLALGLGVPLAPVLGVWAALWNFIPQIGGFVGATPLVALGFAQGPWQGVIALVVFVVYQTFENHVIQPVIGSRVVHVPPLVVLIGALFGGALAGFVGALMAGPVLGVAKVALDHIHGDDHRVDDRVDDRVVTATASVESR